MQIRDWYFVCRSVSGPAGRPLRRDMETMPSTWLDPFWTFSSNTTTPPTLCPSQVRLLSEAECALAFIYHTAEVLTTLEDSKSCVMTSECNKVTRTEWLHHKNTYTWGLKPVRKGTRSWVPRDVIWVWGPCAYRKIAINSGFRDKQNYKVL